MKNEKWMSFFSSLPRIFKQDNENCSNAKDIEFYPEGETTDMLSKSGNPVEVDDYSEDNEVSNEDSVKQNNENNSSNTKNTDLYQEGETTEMLPESGTPIEMNGYSEDNEFLSEDFFEQKKEQSIKNRIQLQRFRSDIIIIFLLITILTKPYIKKIHEIVQESMASYHVNQKDKISNNNKELKKQMGGQLISVETIESDSKKNTVKVIASEKEIYSSGTGFIFEKSSTATKSHRYYFLTSKHTFEIRNLKRLSLTVITSQERQRGELVDVSKDEQIKIHKKALTKYNLEFVRDKDIQIAYFESNKEYTPVNISNRTDIKLWDKVYIRGYPCEAGNCSDKQQSKFIKSNIGKLDLIPAGFTLFQGYSIPYMNGVEPGTSGSPVINEYGEVIAVNGLDRRAEGFYSKPYSLSNNGGEVSKEKKELMEIFSWGIDIRKFKTSN
jgi:Trypsin-like peptidase domain